jgi:hypothetical protein
MPDPDLLAKLLRERFSVPTVGEYTPRRPPSTPEQFERRMILFQELCEMEKRRRAKGEA